MGGQGWAPVQSDAVLGIWIVAGAEEQQETVENFPRLDSVRGRRGGRDETASKITREQESKQQLAIDWVCSSYRTLPRPIRPRHLKAQTGLQGERRTELSIQSSRMHVEIACPLPYPNSIYHSHSLHSLLHPSPSFTSHGFSPTLLLHTHTHTLSPACTAHLSTARCYRCTLHQSQVNTTLA